MLGVVFAVIAIAPFFAYLSYQSYLDDKYRNALTNWGLPSELMDYNGQLQSLTIEDKDVLYWDWLGDFKKLTAMTLNLRYSVITDLSALHELKQLTTLTLHLGNSDITDLSTLTSLKAGQITLDIKDTKINSLKGIPNLNGLTMGND